MAGKKPPPPTTGAFPAMLPCLICRMPGAGLGGLCAACANGVIGGGGGWTTIGGLPPTPPLSMATIAQAYTAAQQAMQATSTHFPRQQPAPLPRADMQVVDLIGWRVWRITSLGYLRSLTAEAIWLPGEPMDAVEIYDQLTDPRGPTGVHVFKERKGAVLELENYATAHSGAASFAIGSVLLWGDVVEHERGYRAERAKILSIDDVTWKGKPPWDKETAEVLGFLRRRYGLAGEPPP